MPISFPGHCRRPARRPGIRHGPTRPDGLPKPDVVAPGVRLFGPLVPHSKYDHPEIPHIGHDYVAITGTSQATPLVSGVVADMLQADPELTPQQVKDIIQQTSRHYLHADANTQGAGVIDAPAAVAKAAAMAQPSHPSS
ncbi:MAG: S8 family serine peptidase [Candidatus Xenobia bacterium]